jgi:hypothetical protein
MLDDMMHILAIEHSTIFYCFSKQILWSHLSSTFINRKHLSITQIFLSVLISIYLYKVNISLSLVSSY